MPNPRTRKKEGHKMAEARSRLSLNDVRASVRRIQTEGEKLVSRLRRDARALSTRNRRETVTGLLNDARRLQADLRKRAEKAIRELEDRRNRILTTLEEQATRVAETVARRLNVATQAEIAALHKRIGELERRIESVAKERAA